MTNKDAMHFSVYPMQKSNLHQSDKWLCNKDMVTKLHIQNSANNVSFFIHILETTSDTTQMNDDAF